MGNSNSFNHLGAAEEWIATTGEKTNSWRRAWRWDCLRKNNIHGQIYVFLQQCHFLYTKLYHMVYNLCRIFSGKSEYFNIVCLQKSGESKGKMCCVMAYKQLVVNKAYLGYFIYILTCYLRTFFSLRIHIKLFG